MSDILPLRIRTRSSFWFWCLVVVGVVLTFVAVSSLTPSRSGHGLSGHQRHDATCCSCQSSGVPANGAAACNHRFGAKPKSFYDNFGPPLLAAVVAFVLAGIVYWIERNHLETLMKREVAIEMHSLFSSNELERARRESWLWLMQDKKRYEKRLKSFARYVLNPVKAGEDPEFLKNCQALSTVLHFWGGIETLLADKAISETMVKSLFASRYRSWYMQVVLPAQAAMQSRVAPGGSTRHLPVWCSGTPLLRVLCFDTSESGTTES